MLYNPYAKEAEHVEYEFIDGVPAGDNEKAGDEEIEEEEDDSVEKPNLKEDQECAEAMVDMAEANDIAEQLSILRQRVQPYLEPLYSFIGMIEGALGGKNDDYWYKFKSGVHSATHVRTEQELYLKHLHIPKQWIDDIRIDLSNEKWVNPKLGDNAGEIERVARQSPYRDAEAIRNLWQAVLNNVAWGTIEMAKEEINTDVRKNFTLVELMINPEVRGMFARFVASKLADGRNYNADNRANGQYARYIVAPSFKQMTAKAKFGIGMKKWWEDVYTSPKNIDGLLQQIRQMREDYVRAPNVVEKQRVILELIPLELQALNNRVLTRIVKRRENRRFGSGIMF